MNDEEFDVKLVCLNALYGSGFHGMSKWEYVEARKQHTDEFGDTIQASEVYFRRNRGGFAYDMFKVSRRSMETILELLFFKNEPFLAYTRELKAKINELGDKELKEAFQRAFDEPDMKPTKKPRNKPIKKSTNKKRPRPEGFKRIK